MDTFTQQTTKFTKVAAGWYATEDGKFAVIADDGDGVREWAFIVSVDGGARESKHVGDTIDWHATKRDAMAQARVEIRAAVEGHRFAYGSITAAVAA